jgi:hypothetical protein
MGEDYVEKTIIGWSFSFTAITSCNRGFNPSNLLLNDIEDPDDEIRRFIV